MQQKEDFVPRENSGYAWIVVFAGVLVIMGAIGFARFGYTLILPRMSKALSMSETGAGGVATANLTGYLLFSLLAGVLATRFSPRLVIAVALVITGVALFCTGLVKTIPAAGVWRFLAGAGGGANVPMMGLISVWFSSRRRGLASGIVVSGSSFSLLLTGLILPSIMTANDVTGWRNSWYLLGAVTVLIAVIAAFVIRDGPASKTHVQRNRKKVTIKSIRISRVWPLAGLYMLFGFSYVIFVTFYADYLISEAGLQERSAGGLWSLIGGVSVASGFVWGAISDRFGRRIAFVGIFALQSCAYLTFALWQGMAGYVIATLLFALTAWSIPAVVGAAVGDTFGPAAAPAVFGFVTLIFGIGQSLGPIVAGAVAESAGTFTVAFLLAAGAALSGIPVSLFAKVQSPSQTDLAGGD